MTLAQDGALRMVAQDGAHGAHDLGSVAMMVTMVPLKPSLGLSSEEEGQDVSEVLS